MSYGGGTPIGDGGGTTYGGGSGRENRISADQVNETKPFSLFVCAFLCSLGTPPPKTTTVSDNISHAQTHHYPIFFFLFCTPLHTQCDYVFKFIIIGDTGTGKSCALHQFIEGAFKQGVHKHTIGVEYGSKVIQLAGKTIKLQIWDTAGQERFRSVTRSYYRNAAAALIFYSINDSSTFDHLSSWLVDSRQMGRKDISVVLTGNKSDLKDERQVTFLEASRFAQENEALFLETSALTGENVEEVFLKAARSVLSKIESGVIDSKNGMHGWLCCVLPLAHALY